MSENLEALTGQLLDIARKAGAEHADAMAVDGQSLSIDVLKGSLEHAERSEAVEIGLRVLVGPRQACVSASDISATTMQEMAERAVAMAKSAPEDPFVGLADAALLSEKRDASGLDLCESAAMLSAAELQEKALEAEAAASGTAGVSQVQGTGAGSSRTRIHIAMSNGFSGGYDRSSTGVHCTAISGEGLTMERDYAYESRVYAADLPSPREIGALAGERAVARAGARKPPTGMFPVVYDERISSGLIGHLIAAIGGTSVVRGSSWLRDAMGEQVLPEGLDLIADPHRPRIGGSRPFDAEGLPTKKLAIVEHGILQSWVLDLATARQLGLSSTGHASRGTSSPPSPSLGNLALTPGAKSREELLDDMGTGLLITSLIGSSINQTTGDYSRGASGYWIENGEIVYPVNECTVAGNLREMLKTIIPANDAKAHESRQVPSVLVEGLTIAGA